MGQELVRGPGDVLAPSDAEAEAEERALEAQAERVEHTAALLRAELYARLIRDLALPLPDEESAPLAVLPPCITGIGVRFATGRPTVVVLSTDRSAAGRLLPPSVAGFELELRAAGKVRAACGPGDAVAHVALHGSGDSGTLGCLVERAGKHYLLSCYHVLVEMATDPHSDGDVVETARGRVVGASQQGALPGVQFGRARNRFDAALAEATDPQRLHWLVDGARLSAPQRHGFDRPVWKVGAGSRLTTRGDCTSLGDIRVAFDRAGGRSAVFEDQLWIESGEGSFAQGGDSGALVVEKRRGGRLVPVGLVFAVDPDGGVTYANQLVKIFTRQGLKIL